MVSGLDFGSRGGRFDEMLVEMRRTWAESGGEYSVGPDVSADQPELVIGGGIERTFKRAAEHGDGWIMGGGTPGAFAEGREKLDAAWSGAGREGEPRRMSLTHYYAWPGDYADQIAASAAKDEDTVRGYIQAFESAGCDELVLFPSSSDPEQVDLLAAAAL